MPHIFPPRLSFDLIANDSRTLLNTLVNHDPDVSSAFHSYLTIAGSADLVVAAYDAEGAIDSEGTKLAKLILDNLVTTNDYTVGYSDKPTLPEIGRASCRERVCQYV